MFRRHPVDALTEDGRFAPPGCSHRGRHGARRRARAAGDWLVAPLGGPRPAATVRIGFALLLALVASPALVAAAGQRARATCRRCTSSLLLAREIIIGLCLGNGRVRRVSRRASCRRPVTLLRGAQSSPRSGPQQPTSAPAQLGVLYLLLATIVFLQIAASTRLWRR
jgi:type III secretory pathway component EscT